MIRMLNSWLAGALRIIPIALTRAFLPINIIISIHLIDSPYAVSSFSLFIALSQIISNFDFGVGATLLSYGRVSSLRKVNGYYAAYFRSFFLKKYTAAIIILGVYYLMVNGNLSLVYILSSFIAAECLIYFNLINNACISRGEYKFNSIVILSIICIQCVFHLCIFYYENTIKYVFEVYIISLFVGVLLAILLIKITDNNQKHEPVKLSKVATMRLQASQISSSLIINKDYVFLYLFGLHVEAAIFASVSRLILFSQQINSVVITKYWVDIAKLGLVTSLFWRQLANLLLITLGTVTPAIILAFLEHDNILMLSTVLVGYVLTNIFSALSSCYAAVDREAIPSCWWNVLAIIVVVGLSWVTYLLHYWMLSIIVSCVYFIILAIKNYRGVRWA